jgi:hypothetical protein
MLRTQAIMGIKVLSPGEDKLTTKAINEAEHHYNRLPR